MTSFSTSNSTTVSWASTQNGGQPHNPGNHEVAHFQGRRAGPGDRVQGQVYAKRPKSPEHLPRKTIDGIKAAQIRAGVREPDEALAQEEPPPLTSAASRSNQGWGDWLASWFSGSPPASPSGVDGDVEDQPRMREGILTGKLTLPPIIPEKCARDSEVWVDVLKTFFGNGNVHVVDMPPATWPFVRNVATVTPNGTLLTSKVTEAGKGKDRARDAVEDYFRKLGLPVQRLKQADLNFANVEYVSSEDTLIVAHSDYHPVNDLVELRRAFGNPKHVLVVSLDLSKDKPGIDERCYDLDLALHVTMNADGKPVALLHEDCLKENIRRFGVLSASQFKQAMVDLDFTIVPITEDEQRMLAANSVSNPDRPGELLFTRDRISPSLVKRLEAAGVEAVKPQGKKLLGYLGPQDEKVQTRHGALPSFGLHCLTLNIRVPLPEPEPESTQTDDARGAKDAL